MQFDVTIVFLDPDFVKHAKSSAIRVFKADIGLLQICINFQDLIASYGALREGQNSVRGGAILIPNELVLSFRGSYGCANFGKYLSRKCDRESAHRRTH